MDYKLIYETYGLTVCAKMIRQSKEHVCREAKKKGWKSPSADHIADNIVKYIINN